ncbi:PREDICTED: uncharacterized protein LOC109114989 [Nelumbo nucifera]|uniref:Uncharacterized protein LOC109114989 n=1 Tax=Nelumbo nucifera TaxID=4432 RepID=A0A1U8Q7R8_NELNU|nr:PREDICTED: uncharacterized protein LOC109114989 [Nelumbo nucifera]
MTEAKPLTSPMAITTNLSKFSGDPLPNPSEYRSIIGTLQYVTITRPDISFSVNKVCQFLHSPTIEHWTVVKWILRYLKHSVNHGLHFHSTPAPLTLQAFSDADWAGCLDDRRSTRGYLNYLGRNLVSWSSKKQASIAHSSTKSEFRVCANAATELLWICSLLLDLKQPPARIPMVWCDNIGAAYLAANLVFHARTKHIEVDFHFLCDLILKRSLFVQFIYSADQVADLFTKPLSGARFTSLRSKLHVLLGHFT